MPDKPIHRCHVSGKIVAAEHAPILVRITAALVPDANRVPSPSDLSPFLRSLLYELDGSPRQGPNHGRIELTATEFDACFKVDLARIAPAFSTQETPAQELVRLRAELAALKVDSSAPA